jgi:hypothetical protein
VRFLASGPAVESHVAATAFKRRKRFAELTRHNA